MINEETGVSKDSPADLQQAMLMSMATNLISRSELSYVLGKSYNNERDLYEALGYSKILNVQNFRAFFERTFARRLVELPAVDSWRLDPVITDSEDGEETPFSKAVNDLFKEKKVYKKLLDLDIACGIGQYGIMFCGFNDGKKPNTNLGKANKLLYMQVYAQDHADIVLTVHDKTNERFSLPLQYQLSATLAESANITTLDIPAHWSRVIHVADNTLESDTYGASRIEAAYNYIETAEKVLGGSGEAFFRGCKDRMILNLPADAKLGPQDKTDLETQVKNFTHNFSDMLRLKGLAPTPVKPNIVSPLEHMEALFTILAVLADVPKRRLMGTERGELATKLDERQWNLKMSGRRTKFNEPNILRPFLDTNIKAGVLPEPKDGNYNVAWPDLLLPSEKEQAEVGEIRTKSMVAYGGSPEAQAIMPAFMFRTKILGLTQEEATKLGEDDDLSFQTEEEEKEEAERLAEEDRMAREGR